MKFTKFLKSLGGDGVIQEYGNSTFLASPSVIMAIPSNMSGILASSITDMPKGISEIVNMADMSDPCYLAKAVMPDGNSVIKDCIRVYADENGVKLPITNDDYTLIEKGDTVEMIVRYDDSEEEYAPVALVIKRYYSSNNIQLLGLIFPVADYVGQV